MGNAITLARKVLRRYALDIGAFVVIALLSAVLVYLKVVRFG